MKEIMSPSAVTFGIILMPLWSVENWGFPAMVQETFYSGQTQPIIMFLSFAGAIALQRGLFSTEESPLPLEFTCTGSETKLKECFYTGIVEHECIRNDAGVVCQGEW